MLAVVVVAPVTGSGADVWDCVWEDVPSRLVVVDVVWLEPSGFSTVVDDVWLCDPSSLTVVDWLVVVV